MTQARKPTRAEQRIQRPLQILDAAFEEFTRKGFAAARLENIADRLGVTKGTIYVYFETKEKLFASIIEYMATPFQDAFEAYRPSSDDPVKELESLLGFLFDHLIDDRKTRELFRLVVSEGFKFPELIDRHHKAFMEPVTARIELVLKDGVNRKKFRACPHELAKVVISPLVGTVIFWLIFDDRRSIDREAILSSQLELIMRGLLV